MREHQNFVYIVCSNSGTLYIGMTNSISRRALQHKRGEVDGFAAKYDCDRMVCYEGFDDVLKAIDREKQLKRWVRRKKTALIESKNPRWLIWQRNGERRWRLRENRSKPNNLSS
jgi:putative endonuclease